MSPIDICPVCLTLFLRRARRSVCPDTCSVRCEDTMARAMMLRQLFGNLPRVQLVRSYWASRRKQIKEENGARDHSDR